MSTRHRPHFTPDDIEEARRLNRVLHWVPRIRLRNRFDASAVQAMLCTAQLAQRPVDCTHVRIENRCIPAGDRMIRLRITTPTEAPPSAVYLDIHGGGWVLGNARMNDRLNAEIAAENGFAVVSVDYRLATRAGLEGCMADCADAARWLLDHAAAEFGTTTILIGGESAGAHLAATSLLALRREGAPLHAIKGVLLFYGPFDFSGTPSLRRAPEKSLILHGPTTLNGLAILSGGRSEKERRRPDLSPAYADLRGLPPALLIVGEHDPLLDDSRILARRWARANGNAELCEVPEAPHGFNRFTTQMARKTNAFARDWLRERLAVPAAVPAVAANGPREHRVIAHSA